MGKGGSFEREINAELSLWFSEGERDDLFTRSDGSGGRFTRRAKKGKDTANQGGDCSFCHPDGEPLIRMWCIEMKTGYGSRKKVKDADGDVIQTPVYSPKNKGVIVGWKNKVAITPWDVLDFVDSRKKKTVLQEMWDQCSRDAELTNRIPVLIFRRNLRTPCICFTSQYFYQLGSDFGNPKGTITIRIKAGEEDLTILGLKDFFNWTINFRQVYLEGRL